MGSDPRISRVVSFRWRWHCWVLASDKSATLGEHVVFVDEFEHKFHNIDNPDTLRTTWDIA